MTQTNAVEVIVRALDSKKAKDIVALKVSDLTIIADYFIICDGSSVPQIKALADEAEVKMKEKLGISPRQVQGTGTNEWVILDYGDIVVHIFLKSQRDFYNLERLWSDAPMVEVSEWTTED